MICGGEENRTRVTNARACVLLVDFYLFCRHFRTTAIMRVRRRQRKLSRQQNILLLLLLLCVYANETFRSTPRLLEKMKNGERRRNNNDKLEDGRRQGGGGNILRTRPKTAATVPVCRARDSRVDLIPPPTSVRNIRARRGWGGAC